jgi:hypothetical protein
MNKNNIQLSIIIYLIFISVLLYIKPQFINNENGELKQFGTGTKQTIIPLWLIILLGAFFSYFIAQIIIFKFNL